MYKIYWNWNMKNDNMIYNKMITWYEKKKKWFNNTFIENFSYYYRYFNLRYLKM